MKQLLFFLVGEANGAEITLHLSVGKLIRHIEELFITIIINNKYNCF